MDQSHPGEHEAIIDCGLFGAVQKKLSSNLVQRRHKHQASEALLVGRIALTHHR